MNVSEYFLYKECPRSNRLIIVFSGRAARNFNLYRIIENVEINKIFIRDPSERTWYNSSLPGEEGWSGIDGLVEKIRSYVKNFDIDNVYLTGGSMGGYAALIAAFKLGIKKCLIFSPQISLDYRLPNNPNKEVFIKYNNAFDLYNKIPDLKLQMIIGSDEISDVYNAINVSKFVGVEVLCIKSSPHNALFFLAKNKLLNFVIDSFLQDKNIDVVLPLFDFFKNDLFVEVVGKITEGFYHDKYSFVEMNELIDFASKRAPFWAVLPYIKGKLFEKFDKAENAVEFYEHAIKLSPENSAFHLDFGNMLMKIGEVERAEMEFLAAVEYSEAENYFFYFKLGVSCLLQKKYDEAFLWQNKAIAINRKFSSSYYQLGLIENIRKNYESAVLFFNEALKLKDKNPNLMKHLNTAKKNLSGFLHVV